jgi:hypothetical protein
MLMKTSMSLEEMITGKDHKIMHGTLATTFTSSSPVLI